MHSSLKRFLSLYFAHFDTLNPLMHRPTFNPQATEPHLLLAMMAIGAFYGSDEECAVWQRLVPGLAGLVVVSEGFGPDASVQTILTTLLVEIHGKLSPLWPLQYKYTDLCDTRQADEHAE